MKKKISVILLLCMLLNVGSALGYQDQSIADNYDSFLRSSGDRRISKEAMKNMWMSFWDYIGVKKHGSNDNGNDKQYSNNNGKEHNISNSNGCSNNTIAGGNGVDDVDGPNFTAQFNTVNSLAVNSEDNIYFIDHGKLKVTSKGNINTVTNAPQNLTYTKVVCNRCEDSIYAAGYDENKSYIYRVYPDKKLITYTNHKYKHDIGTNPRIFYADFIEFDLYNNLWFSDRFGASGKPTHLNYLSQNDLGKPSQVMGTCAWFENKQTTFPQLTGTSAAIVKDDRMFVLNTGKRKLYEITKYPREIIQVAEFDTFYDCVCSYDNNFYVAKGSTVKKIDIYGEVKRIIESTDDKNMNITAMAVDNHNNLIVNEVAGSKYDPDNSYIKKIKL